MNFIKNVVGTMVLGAASVIGMFTGLALWNSGLDDAVEKRAKKLFSKKEES